MIEGMRELAARIRNLFATGNLSRREGATIQGTTRFGRTVEGTELHPYGFASRARKGTVLFLFEGGDARSPALLHVSDQEGAPDLNEGDAALWSASGGWVVVRAAGSVELNGSGFGGLVKVDELRTQLDKNSAILQSILTTLSTPILEPGNGLPSAFQAELLSACAGKTPGDFTAIESDKVFHGDGAS